MASSPRRAWRRLLVLSFLASAAQPIGSSSPCWREAWRLPSSHVAIERSPRKIARGSRRSLRSAPAGLGYVRYRTNTGAIGGLHSAAVPKLNTPISSSRAVPYVLLGLAMLGYAVVTWQGWL